MKEEEMCPPTLDKIQKKPRRLSSWSLTAGPAVTGQALPVAEIIHVIFLFCFIPSSVQSSHEAQCRSWALSYSLTGIFIFWTTTLHQMAANTHIATSRIMNTTALTCMTPCCLCTCRSIWLSVKFSRPQAQCVNPQTILLYIRLKRAFIWPLDNIQVSRKTASTLFWKSWRDITPFCSADKDTL